VVVLRVNVFGAQPWRESERRVLLKKELFVDAIRITLERKRTVAQMRKNERRNGIVVIDDVALGDAFAGIEDLIEIGQLKPMVLDVEGHFGRRV